MKDNSFFSEDIARNYDEIMRNMGYRLVLSSSTLNNSNLTLNINSVGYAKILFEKKVYLVLRNALNVDFKRLLPLDIRRLNKGGNTVNITVPNDVPEDTYDLFLHISDKNAALENTPAYSIQFGNIGLWESTTGYNDLQQTITISSASFSNKIYGLIDSQVSKITDIDVTLIKNINV
jgi:uncharacterized protein YciU (UPF0263 family)